MQVAIGETSEARAYLSAISSCSRFRHQLSELPPWPVSKSRVNECNQGRLICIIYSSCWTLSWRRIVLVEENVEPFSVLG